MSFVKCYQFQLLDVYRVKRGAATADSMPRSWSALALRLSGESMFTADGPQLYAGAGSLLYIPAGVGFSRESTEEELIVLHLRCPEEEAEWEVLYQHSSVSAFSCFQAIWKEWEAKVTGYQHRCNALLHTLLAGLEETGGQQELPYRQQLILEGTRYLDANYDDPAVSISQAAGLCHISEAYFRRLYKDTYGISPHQAVMEKRLQKACRLLQSGYFSVEETATRSGFENCKYFSTLFRRRMNMSPREYRQYYCNSSAMCLESG